MSILPAYRLRLALAALSLLAAGLQHARGEELVAALSQETVFIRSNFTGASLTLFGSIERDAATVGRSGTYDLVSVVRGPQEEPVVRRKAKFFGIWLNRDSMHFHTIPSYYSVQTNRSLSLIADEAVLKRYEIGMTNLDFRPIEPSLESEQLLFSTALVRLRLATGMFSDSPAGISFLNEHVFSTRINLPANVRIGPYTIELYLFRDGALLAREMLNFGVRKTDFEALVFELSQERPILYGTICVILALGLGWLAGLMFRPY